MKRTNQEDCPAPGGEAAGALPQGGEDAGALPQGGDGRRVLVLGGSKFIGRSTVSAFVKAGWSVTTYNRGKTHWHPHEHLQQINRVIGDRSNEASFFKYLISSGPWDAVVDFTSFDGEDVSVVIEGLRSVKHYVFISTDSVYEVCPSSISPRTEDTAIRPQDPNLRQQLHQKDKYGSNKLECEEVLQAAFEKGGFPYTSLRLPDIFGPYDTTKRHWRYQVWLKCGEESKVELSKSGREKPLSFVYSEDVSSAILAVIEAGPSVFGHSLNIAQEETPTLEQYLRTVASCIGVRPQFLLSDKVLYRWLPSVKCGPVSIEKAKRMLKWRPTPMGRALEETCAWHEAAWGMFPKKRPVAHLPVSAIVRLEGSYSSPTPPTAPLPIVHHPIAPTVETNEGTQEDYSDGEFKLEYVLQNLK
eukprot:TRINITY_DN2704_c0_g1_i1.p1 TRINITY_DN2704_c0_g1~~TRINITY_DN2704_c0_g1_i1.p1  ORF type:complete len:415 (-),score=75.39 TRINITY_DN2704_c0_g1_i1:38-1282(-)